MLAHHQDDQHETMLMRLSRKHLLKLQTEAIVNIPECFGIHGLYQSGDPVPTPQIVGSAGQSCVTCIEQPAFKLLRPLLRFPKARLMETCRQFGVPWVEDETNADRSLTERNALRFILTAYRLPEALNKANMLSWADKLQERAAQQRDEGLNIYEQCDIKLDVRSGIAHVRIPKLTRRGIFKSVAQSRQATESPSAARQLVQRFVNLVVPDSARNSRSDSDLAGFMNFLRNEQLKAISLGKALISRVDPSDETISKADVHFQSYTNLRICRPLPRETEIESTSLDYPKSDTAATGGFQLWDGRFWLSVHNPSNESLRVRFFQKHHKSMLDQLLALDQIQCKWSSDQKGVRYTLPGVREPPHRYLNRVIHSIVRGDVRYTLPVIEYLHHGRPIPLALPTLGLSFVGTTGADWPDWADLLKWEVRYKAIDLGSHEIKDCVVGLP